RENPDVLNRLRLSRVHLGPLRQPLENCGLSVGGRGHDHGLEVPFCEVRRESLELSVGGGRNELGGVLNRRGQVNHSPYNSCTSNFMPRKLALSNYGAYRSA